MAADLETVPAGALAPLAPGPLIELSRGNLQVEIAPQAGGRIAQIKRRGIEQLAGFDQSNAAMIGWGCFPMLPWAGRVRRGEFEFGGQQHQLPLNMGVHAIHGVGFAMPWQVDVHESHHLALSLALPQDQRWPFGGTAYHRIELDGESLLLQLALQAGDLAMPATIGWHPWFRKPAHLRFSPTGMYPRDEDGIATLPIGPPSAGPWDDCFINTGQILIETSGQQLQLSSDCRHWVVYDHGHNATCIEPQSGPPDAFNLEPFALAPGQTLAKWFRMAWNDC